MRKSRFGEEQVGLILSQRKRTNTVCNERMDVFDGFLNCCRWIEVFYAWRPNLPDEADNHLVELGVAAQAQAIVTRNLRDVSRGELKFPALAIVTPEQCLEKFPCPR